MSSAADDALEGIAHQYALHFAGKDRLTRVPALLLHMAEAAEALLPDLQGPLRGAAAIDARRYRDEHAAIVKAQAEAGPQACAVAMLRERTQVLTHRFTRHFLGQPRPACDLGLIGSMQQEAAQLAERAHSCGAAGDALDGHLKALGQAYAKEGEAIAASRHQGAPETQAYWCGAAVNRLVDAFHLRVHGQPMLTCAPDLVLRLQGALADLGQQLLALDAAHPELRCREDALEVGRMAEDWQRIANEVQSAHSAAPVEMRVSALGEQVDSLLADYNQSMASEAPRERLGRLCDQLDDVEAQLFVLAAEQAAQEAPQQALVAADALAVLMAAYDARPLPATPQAAARPTQRLD